MPMSRKKLIDQFTRMFMACGHVGSRTSVWTLGAAKPIWRQVGWRNTLFK